MSRQPPLHEPERHADVPALVEHIADRPAYHVACHDCIAEAVHPSLRAAASEERAHKRAHDSHAVTVRRIDE